MPPLGEQRAIADYLDTETARIDALITKKRRLITLLEERSGCPSSEACYLARLIPFQRIGSAPSGSWDVLNLGVLIELQRGHDLPADQRRRWVGSDH